MVQVWLLVEETGVTLQPRQPIMTPLVQVFYNSKPLKINQKHGATAGFSQETESHYRGVCGHTSMHTCRKKALTGKQFLPANPGLQLQCPGLAHGHQPKPTGGQQHRPQWDLPPFANA